MWKGKFKEKYEKNLKLSKFYRFLLIDKYSPFPFFSFPFPSLYSFNLSVWSLSMQTPLGHLTF